MDWILGDIRELLLIVLDAIMALLLCRELYLFFWMSMLKNCQCLQFTDMFQKKM